MNDLPESKLLKKLKGKKDGPSLFDNVQQVRAKAAPILGRISNFFDDYTIHDVSHSDQVLANLDLIIPSKTWGSMNSSELYILAIACYLHDVGMAVTTDEITKIKSSPPFEKFKRDQKIAHPDKDEEDILKDYIRAIHQRRSEDYVLKNWEGERGLMIRGYTFAKASSIVARGHRQEDLLDFSLFDPKYYVVSGKDPVCLPFLACCLMLADELDITRERTPELLCKFVDPKKPVNKKEWDRCRSTLAVGTDGTKIKIQAECENPKIHKAILESAKKVQNTIDLSHKVVLNLPQDLKDKYCIAVDGVANPKIEAKGYLYREFRFEVDEDFVTRMFMGDKLYPSKWDFLRELLQNSIDTCRLKSKIKANYVPKVSLGLSADKNKLWIEDNGMGMDEFIIENFLMKIGRTYYRSYEYKEKYGNLGLSPISEFGIGLFSCFMVADSLAVETLMDGNSPIRLEVEGLPEDFVIRPGSKNEFGTTVELNLKKEIREEINDELLETKVGYYARHVEFPIELLKRDGSKSNITDKGFDFNVEDLLKPFAKPKANQYEIVSSQIKPTKSNPIRGKIGIVLERTDDDHLMPAESFYYDFNNEGLGDLGIKLSQKGIFVGSSGMRHSLRYRGIAPMGIGYHVRSRGWIGDINIENASLLDLSLSRDRLSETAGTDALDKIIDKHMSTLVERLFAKDWNRFDRKKLAAITLGFISRYDFPGVLLPLNPTNQKLRDIIMKYFIFVCFIDGGVDSLSLNEFTSRADRWILMQRRINTEESKLKEAIERLDHEYRKSEYILGDPSNIREHYDFLEKFFQTSYDRSVVISNRNMESYYEYIKRDKPTEEKQLTLTYYDQDLCTFSNQPQLLITGVALRHPMNKRHPFMETIVSNADKIERGNSSTFFKQFFEELSRFCRPFILYEQKQTNESLNELREKQKTLLNWLVENKLISKREANGLLLKKEDFPFWLFK
jgi:hypothetical protein